MSNGVFTVLVIYIPDIVLRVVIDSRRGLSLLLLIGFAFAVPAIAAKIFEFPADLISNEVIYCIICVEVISIKPGH